MKIVEQYLHEYHYATRVYPFIEPDVNPSWEGHLTVRFPTKLDQYDAHPMTEPVIEVGNWKLSITDALQLQEALAVSIRLMLAKPAESIPAPVPDVTGGDDDNR